MKYYTFFVLLSVFVHPQHVHAATIWSENFTAQEGKGIYHTTALGVQTNISGMTNWTVSNGSLSTDTSLNWWMVTNGHFEGQDVGGVATWESMDISVSGSTSVSFQMDFAQLDAGMNAGEEYFKVFYTLDGGSEQEELYVSLTNQALYTTITWTSSVIDVSAAVTFTVVARINVNGADDGWAFDDITVEGAGTPATNVPPVLSTIGHQQVGVSSTLQFSVTATPTDADSVTLSMSNAPAGAILSSTNENGTFVWTSAAPVGVYTTTFYAADDDGADSETITITVQEPAATSSVLSFTVMAANLSCQTGSCGGVAYAGPCQRIIQGLDPDIVAIQEWNVTNASYRAYVDADYGTGFSYYIEAHTPCSDIPNGIISRWPIIDSGEWNDTVVPNRDFAWATIQIPGAQRLLHVISVHLKAGSTSSDRTDRQNQAMALTNYIATAFSSTNYIVLAGDLNLGSRTETSLTTLKTVLHDDHQPADQHGDKDTNIPRDKPYDLVLPNLTLSTHHDTVAIGTNEFPDGVVFDSRLWTPPPSPMLTNDSASGGIQHLAVMKCFSIASTGTPPTDADADGMTDAWEIQNFGAITNANESTDFDFDGFLDLYEFHAGTMATNADSKLEFHNGSTEIGGDYVVRWSSVTNKTYRLLRSTNLFSGFSPIATNLAATPPDNIHTDTPPVNAEAVLYRIQLE